MLFYSKRYINTISLIISIIIFISLNNICNFTKTLDFNNLSLHNYFFSKVEKIENKISSIVRKTKEENKIQENNSATKNSENSNIINLTKEKNKFEWKIEIPSINLIAPIEEGTSKDIMNKSVGHFEDTAKTEGNVGLAAHNRGYPVNYFADLKRLKEGDEITYKYKDFQKTYYVKKMEIIRDTEWSYLEETEENMLTLITCVENEPSYRRCVQAVEK